MPPTAVEPTPLPETPAPEIEPDPEPESTPEVSIPAATPEPTVTAAPPTPAPPTPVPTADELPATPASPAQPTAAPRIRDEGSVRAAEPRPRDLPSVGDQRDVLGASRPTFDLSNRPNRNTAATIRRLEREWQEAVRRHDVAALNDLLAADFVGTSSSGKVGSKSTLLAALRRDKNTYTSVSVGNMSVRTPADDIAVVTGIAREAGTTPDGKRFKSARRFTDTWVRRKGEWRCVASQTTDLSR